jgi:hypothetical protein
MQLTSMTRVILALCTPGALGCQTESVTPVTVGRVTVDPVEISIPLGDALQFNAAVFDEYDASLQGVAVAWSSDRPSVVAVEADGSARALRAGSARVSASFNGISGSGRVTVLSPPECSASEAKGKDKRKDRNRDRDGDDEDDGSDDDDNDDDDEDDEDDDEVDPDDGVACDGQ